MKKVVFLFPEPHLLFPKLFIRTNFIAITAMKFVTLFITSQSAVKPPDQKKSGKRAAAQLSRPSRVRSRTPDPISFFQNFLLHIFSDQKMCLFISAIYADSSVVGIEHLKKILSGGKRATAQLSRPILKKSSVGSRFCHRQSG